MKQRTLKSTFQVSGKGLHTGLQINATFNPAPTGHGYKFKRVDLPEAPIVDAVAENVIETQRGTVIAKGDVKISTIEHALAALYAAGIDNCLIELDAPEMPILDGSAIEYAEKIEEVGYEEQTEEKDFYIVKQKMEVVDENSGASLIALPDDDFSIETMIEFKSPVLSNQFAMLTSMDKFKTEIAASRTFVFVREVEPLVSNNLIKGGDLDNAIVIYDSPMSQENLDKLADLMGVPHKNVSELGYINNKPLVYDNEPARHKLLDVIGDLALIGRPMKGRVIAVCPGHGVNTAFAKQIRKEIRKQEVFAPVIPLDAKPVFDINQIKELLPHRYPFLLVDKVMEVGDNHIVAIKNATFNEMHFIGHFPEEPVMPGVLHVEAMAQCAGILVLSQVEDPKSYSTYFLKIDGVKFRNKVVPGDTIVMKVMLTSPIRRGLATIKGYCFVNGKIVTEAEMTAQIVKNK